MAIGGGHTLLIFLRAMKILMMIKNMRMIRSFRVTCKDSPEKLTFGRQSAKRQVVMMIMIMIMLI